MGVKVDLAKKTVTLSPGALLQPASRRVGWDRGDGFERLWIGQAVHRRVLADALAELAGYQVEKAVRLAFPVDDFTAVLEGRLDGRFVDESGAVVVDEVKSLHFAEELPKLAGSPLLARFEAQLRWYLLAVARTEGVAVRGRLVLADIESGATRVHPVGFDADAVLEDLVGRVRALLDAFFETRALAEAKAAEAETLAFPFERFRPGQREIAAAVERAAAQGDALLVEAPTGIGKTAAALVPLLRAALRQGKRLFVLTAKTTQQEIFVKTLAAVGGESFRSIRLRAKERMCANEVVLCHEDHCPYAKDYGGKLAASGLLGRLLDTETHLSPDLVFEAARQEVVCPFEVSLELSEEADVVVADYNYAFDPIVSLGAFRDGARLSDTIVLVDEVHNLLDRGRGYYSPALSETALRALRAQFGISAARTAPEAEEVAGLVSALLEGCATVLAEGADASDGEPTALVALPLDALEELRLRSEALLVRHLAELRAGAERLPEDPVLELCFSYARFHDVARLATEDGRLDPAFDVLVSRKGGDLELSILCKDPSRLLGRVLNGAAAAVGMSATLSPPEFYRDLLGFDRERTAFLKVPSPFPRENRRVLVAKDVDTRWSARGAAVPRLAALVAEVAAGTRGNVLALFPSYRFLDEVRARVPSLAGRRLLRPSDRSTELERRAALAALSDGGAPVLLFAVSGGAFAEGVDYPGEMLSAVVVVSPALPYVSFATERMRSYFEERYEKGFEYAYVIPGMTRVVQSAGRVIRSETDRGVIVLACRRFLSRPYRDYLPAEWYGDSPDELVAPSVGEATRAFFEEGAGALAPSAV